MIRYIALAAAMALGTAANAQPAPQTCVMPLDGTEAICAPPPGKPLQIEARKGADDATKDTRRGRGRDDASGHA